MFSPEIKMLSSSLTFAREKDDHDEIIGNCDRMYNASFRSGESFLFSALDEDDQEDIVFSAKAASSGLAAPDCEYEYDRYCDAVENTIIPAILADTPVVWLCNYKGEGTGIALLSLAQNMPIFKNKSHSAAHFGA